MCVCFFSCLRAGEEQLASLSLPARQQEAYRYTDLESLYRTDFVAAHTEAGAEAAQEIEQYLLEETKGQQMVFVNGMFNAALSDVSNLGGVEGLVAGHLGGLDGEQLAKVRV